MNFHKYFKYAFVMGLGWIVDNGIYYALTFVTSIPIAIFIARIAGAVTGLILHNKITFSNQTDKAMNVKKALKFTLIWFIGYFCVTYGTLYFMKIGVLGTLLSKILMEVIFVPINYILLQYIVYTEKA